jgi:hypothetical protein
MSEAVTESEQDINPDGSVQTACLAGNLYSRQPVVNVMLIRQI